MRSKLLLTVAALTLLTSCAQVSAQVSGEQVSDDRRPASVRPPLETVEWADLGTMISVLVRNTSDRTLRTADAVITVLDEGGEAVGSSVETTVEGRCCTAVDVPPGGTFGFYLFSDVADQVSDVQIDYRNVAFAPSGSDGGPQASVEPTGLYRDETNTGATVTATVTTEGGPIDAAVVQAVVNDADGEFLAVISGTWFCFDPSEPREIEMQVFQSVPDGARVVEATAFPKPTGMTGGDANVSEPCSYAGEVPEEQDPAVTADAG